MKVIVALFIALQCNGFSNDAEDTFNAWASYFSACEQIPQYFTDCKKLSSDEIEQWWPKHIKRDLKSEIFLQHLSSIIKLMTKNDPKKLSLELWKLTF